MSIIQQIAQLARNAGATHVRLTDRIQHQMHDWVFENCRVNTCGKSGRCWTCPPLNGTVEELTAHLQAYPHGMLIQNVHRIEDSWDLEGMEAGVKAHNQMIRDLSRLIAAHYPAIKLLPLGCGGCGLCEQCTCPDAPCRYPDEAISSVEGYGIDVKSLIEACGLSYINGVNTVSFVGLVLLDCGE